MVSELFIPNISFATCPGIVQVTEINYFIQLFSYFLDNPDACYHVCGCYLFPVLPLTFLFFYSIIFYATNSKDCFLKIYFKKKLFHSQYMTHFYNCWKENFMLCQYLKNRKGMTWMTVLPV